MAQPFKCVIVIPIQELVDRGANSRTPTSSDIAGLPYAEVLRLIFWLNSLPLSPLFDKGRYCMNRLCHHACQKTESKLKLLLHEAGTRQGRRFL